MPATPYHADLMTTVQQLYARLPSRVPATLEVCHCDCCMTHEILAEITATPVRNLTRLHMDEYRNSAHGVPKNPDDLRAMLPRYLDMMARDEWSDDFGVGVDLQRFGDGRIAHAPLFDAQTEALLNQWARLMILHTGAAEAMDQDTGYSLPYLTEVLLVGGWSVDVVTSALDDLFASPHGLLAQELFVAPLGEDVGLKGHFHMWGLYNRRSEAIPEFAIWLNELLCRPAVQDWLVSPEIFAKPWADPLFTLSGNITGESFAIKD
jgi:hypothetical protein